MKTNHKYSKGNGMLRKGFVLGKKYYDNSEKACDKSKK